MTDYTELKRLAEALVAHDADSFYLPCTVAFERAATPDVVLALIAENERLKADLREAKDAKLGLSWALGEIKAENEQARADIVIFKGGISALGEAAKKLCFNARSSGGTAGADQALMDSCDGVENALSLVGVSRAIDYVEGLKADNESLTEKYEAARDRKNSITALQVENEALRKDAERYRWLRDGASVILSKEVGFTAESGARIYSTMPSQRELDSAVDSAMADDQ